ncbi:MAG: hypothetical protein CMI23_12530 [Opitutae bacterium]|nr:hypothetical protein [Opitutae bacterium]|tara:strand:- start:411 stop:671 length:261 start_codon:yes stop_codon:yes gene_type:complete
MIPSTGKERRTLKSMAKVRTVDIKIGKKGLTENAIKEIKIVLERDKMIKVAFSQEKIKRAELVKTLEDSLNSTLIELVGKTATFVI